MNMVHVDYLFESIVDKKTGEMGYSRSELVPILGLNIWLAYWVKGSPNHKFTHIIVGGHKFTNDNLSDWKAVLLIQGILNEEG